MNFRALTLIVLMATWIAPANGYACLPDSSEVAAHAHEHALSAHSHDRDEHSEARTQHEDHGREAAVAVESAGTSGGGEFDELTRCCESGRAASTVDAAVKNAEPQPESSLASTLPLVITSVSPATSLMTTAQLRRQQPPPPLPYEKNRRPLLI